MADQHIDIRLNQVWPVDDAGNVIILRYLYSYMAPVNRFEIFKLELMRRANCDPQLKMYRMHEARRAKRRGMTANRRYFERQRVARGWISEHLGRYWN